MSQFEVYSLFKKTVVLASEFSYCIYRFNNTFFNHQIRQITMTELTLSNAK
jgi:hypothetical protein